MSEDASAGINGGESDDVADGIAVDTRVIVYPGTDKELHGVVVEDFADLAGTAVEIAGERIVGPARRYAVSVDDGGLVFVDDDSVVAEAQPA